jgi:hypothetical protein
VNLHLGSTNTDDTQSVQVLDAVIPAASTHHSMRTYSASQSPSVAASPNASKHSPPSTLTRATGSNIYLSVHIGRSADQSTSNSTHQIGGSDEDGDRSAKLEASVIVASMGHPGINSSSSSSRLQYDIAGTLLSLLYFVLVGLHPRNYGSEIYQVPPWYGSLSVLERGETGRIEDAEHTGMVQAPESTNLKLM